MCSLCCHALCGDVLHYVVLCTELHRNWGNRSESYFREEWKDWGDARIDRGGGAEVGVMMIERLRRGRPRQFVHAMPKGELLRLIGCME